MSVVRVAVFDLKCVNTNRPYYDKILAGDRWHRSGVTTSNKTSDGAHNTLYKQLTTSTFDSASYASVITGLPETQQLRRWASVAMLDGYKVVRMDNGGLSTVDAPVVGELTSAMKVDDDFFVLTYVHDNWLHWNPVCNKQVNTFDHCTTWDTGRT